MANRLSRAITYIVEMMAILSGLAFLLLSFYITIDVIGRYTGWFFTRISDDISAYTLAVGGTWAMAYALRVGGHVQIDILVNQLRLSIRDILMIFVNALTFIFAALLSIYGWRLVIDSYVADIHSITILQAPLFIPQAMVAFGFTILTVEAALILIRMIILKLTTPVTQNG